MVGWNGLAAAGGVVRVGVRLSVCLRVFIKGEGFARLLVRVAVP